MGETLPRDKDAAVPQGSPGLAGEVRWTWWVACGLALLFLWTWLLYWGGPFSLRTHNIELANARWATNVLLCAAALGVSALAAAHPSVNGRRTSLLIRLAGLVFGTLGTGIALWLALDAGVGPRTLRSMALVSGAMTGVAEGCFLVTWCTLTSYLGVRTSLAVNLAAMACSGLLFLLCNVLSAPFALALGVSCPVAGFLCSCGAGARFVGAWGGGASPQREDDADDPDTPGAPDTPVEEGAPPAAPRPRSRSHAARLLHDASNCKLMGIAALFGLSSGFVNASFELVPAFRYWVSCYGVVAGMVAAAALAFLAAFRLNMSAWQLVFRFSLPVMALSFAFLPFDSYALLGPGVQSLGYQFFFATYWPLLGSARMRRDVPASASVSLGLFAAQAGSAAGLCLWEFFCAGAGTDPLGPVSAVALLAFVVVAVLFEKPAFGWADSHPGAQVVLDKPGYDHVVDAAARRYGLSAREAQVCALLGRGRNRQFVSDALGISLETAKTHATNVYRKLGVHSQQELLDVLDLVDGDLSREYSRQKISSSV